MSVFDLKENKILPACLQLVCEPGIITTSVVRTAVGPVLRSRALKTEDTYYLLVYVSLCGLATEENKLIEVIIGLYCIYIRVFRIE